MRILTALWVSALALLTSGGAIAAVPVDRTQDRFQAEVEAFHRLRAERSLWNLRAAKALVQLLETSEVDGLSPDDYEVDRLGLMIKEAQAGQDQNKRLLDLALSKAFVRFAADLADPRDDSVLYVDPAARPRAVNPSALLNRAATAPSLHTFITGMGWMNPVYVQIRQELVSSEGDQKWRKLLQRNLDRARSLPRGPGRYILVNVPSAKLEVRDGERILETMRVGVGQKSMQTPIMAGMMRYAILNPYWHIPTDLTKDRIAPQVLKEGRSYLDSKGYEVVSDFNNPKLLDPMSIDWKAVAAGRREAFVRQRPGVQNGMGEIKFMFPNEMGIYLHDTPGKSLFERDYRLASAGCVRLEDAAGLAHLLLGDAVDRAPSTPEHVLPLPTPIPVYLAYLTAFPERGRMVERPDVYGKDRELAEAAMVRRARTFAVAIEAPAN